MFVGFAVATNLPIKGNAVDFSTREKLSLGLPKFFFLALPQNL
jgi:hypothetical protein